MRSAARWSTASGWRSVLKSLALGLSRRALSQALAPIGQGVGSAISSLLGGLLGGGSFARAAFWARGMTPFAAGGVVATPSFFPTRSGLGLAGEAGPEAILPLKRGAGRAARRERRRRWARDECDVQRDDAGRGELSAGGGGGFGDAGESGGAGSEGVVRVSGEWRNEIRHMIRPHPEVRA